MFTTKIYDFLKFTGTCLKYKRLNFICHILLINCSQDNLTNNYIIEDLFPELLQNSSIIVDDNTETFNFDNSEKLNIQEPYSTELQQNDQSDFLNENNILDEQGGLITTYPPLSPDIFKDLSTCYTKCLSDACAMEVRNYDEKIDLEDIKTFGDLILFDGLTPNKYTKMNHESTISTEQREPLLVPYYYNKEGNINKEINKNTFDIPTAPCSSNYSLNTMNPEANMDSKEVEVIDTGKKDSNTFMGQIFDNQPLENLYINKLTEMDKMVGNVSKMPNDSYYTLINPDTNIKSRQKNKLTKRHITKGRNKEVKTSNRYLVKTLRQKKEKYIQQIDLFRSNVNENNPIFPIDLRELEPSTNYNLNIRIFINSKNDQRTFERTFVFRIEHITTTETKKNELCLAITYSISCIPKFFIPKFYEFKGILSVDEEYNPKLLEFFYTMRRTIELRKSEELKITHLVPYLIPDGDYIWRKKYVEVIGKWEYLFFKFDDLEKIKLLTPINKRKNVSKRIRKFMKSLPDISEENGIKDPIVNEMFKKLTNLNIHMEQMILHDLSSSLEQFKNGCKDIYKFSKQFFDTGKLEPPLKRLDPIEIEVAAVYEKIYYYYMSLSKSILYCYNNFLREDNEDMLTY